jgi:predicted porin
VTIGNVATSGDGRTYANAGNASFERRQGNSVQYWSPALSGLTLRAAYSVNEGKPSRSDAITQVNPDLLAASLEYTHGIYYIGYAYERHDDYFGLDALVPAAQATPVAAVGGSPGASSRDRGEKLVARVTLGDTQLGVIGERLRYTKSVSPAAAGAFNRYERPAVALALVQRLGSHAIRALYGKAQDGSCSRTGGASCDTSGLGARQVSLGYSHSFSKRTDLYAFYTRVDNDARGSYQFANGAGVGAAPGAASIGYLAGMRHVF